MAAPNARIYNRYYWNGMTPYVGQYNGQTLPQQYPGRSATMDDSLNGCECSPDGTSGIDMLGIQIPTWVFLAAGAWYLFGGVAKHHIGKLKR